MVEVPKYAEIQKYAGPVFLAALAYWLLPLPEPLPRHRAWAALACIGSGSVLAWMLLLKGVASYSTRRKVREEQEQEEAASAALRVALLAKLRALAPDERAVVAAVYEDPNGRIQAETTRPALIQLERSKIIQYLCNAPGTHNDAIYTLAPVVRWQIDRLGIESLSGPTGEVDPPLLQGLYGNTDSD